MYSKNNVHKYELYCEKDKKILFQRKIIGI